MSNSTNTLTTKWFVIRDEEAFGVSETILITYVRSLHEKDGTISQKPAASISYNTFSLYPFSGLLTVNKIAAGISLESLNPGKKAAPLSFETTLLAWYISPIGPLKNPAIPIDQK